MFAKLAYLRANVQLVTKTLVFWTYVKIIQSFKRWQIALFDVTI